MQSVIPLNKIPHKNMDDGPRPPQSSYIINTMRQEKIQNINDSQVIKEALGNQSKEYQPKTKNTYVIEPRTNRSRTHMSGYETIRLKQEDVDPLLKEQKKQLTARAQSRLNTAIDFSKQSPFIQGVENAEQVISQRLGLQTRPREEADDALAEPPKRPFFLPLDFYNLDDEDFQPYALLEKYREPPTTANEPRRVLGFSKWFGTDDKFEWRQCRVLGYSEDEERYQIEWDSGKQKLVSRINLRFARYRIF